MGFGLIGKGQILEKWSRLIYNAAGLGERLIADMRQLIQESDIQDVRIQRRGMSPGLMRGITGGKRSFVIITNTGSSNLKPFRIYLNVRDYGSDLQVTWFVVLQPNMGEKLMAFFLSIPLLGLLFLPFHFLGRLICAKQSGILEMDTFDDLDLAAYITTIHSCLLDAVERLMEELMQNFFMDNKHPQGFLGIAYRDR